jgi:hypothetical protein
MTNDPRPTQEYQASSNPIETRGVQGLAAFLPEGPGATARWVESTREFGLVPGMDLFTQRDLSRDEKTV